MVYNYLKINFRNFLHDKLYAFIIVFGHAIGISVFLNPQKKIVGYQMLLVTVLAIFVACLGLLGMITNRVTEKIKEIGVRKVLGAHLHQIAQILLNTTVKQAIVATAIGIPLAYLLTQQCLEKFSERVALQLKCSLDVNTMGSLKLLKAA